MSRIITTASVLCLLLANVACGDKGRNPVGPTPTPPPPVVTQPTPTPTPAPAPSPTPAPTACPAPYKAGSMSASINGSSWVARCVLGLSVTAPAPVGTTVSVAGTDLATSQRIVAFAFNPNGPGTYAVANGTITEGSSASVIRSGSVTVRAISPTGVSGTFTLESPDRTVTGGEFDVTF